MQGRGCRLIELQLYHISTSPHNNMCIATVPRQSGLRAGVWLSPPNSCPCTGFRECSHGDYVIVWLGIGEQYPKEKYMLITL